MSVNYIVEKIKGLALNRVAGSEKEIFLILTIVFTGLLGFGLGRLSKIEDRRVPIKIIGEKIPINTGVLSPKQGALAGQYVASVSGSTYYLPWCGGVGRIKENNKVWFNTKEQAEAAGYRPASNCKGL